MRRDTRGIARKLALGAGAGVALAMLGSACVVHDDDDGCYDCYGPPADEPYLATIDADVTLSTELGYGAGIFVEYTRGGLWNLWTSCDTELYGYACYWDVYVTSYGTIDSVALYDVEAEDYTDLHDASTFSFHTVTSYYSDGVEFFSQPGELIEITAYLDGDYDRAHQYYVWFGNGVLHEGAPRQPVTFLPDTP